MGLLDTLLGRTKPVRANLDALFSLPSAAVTLQAAEGMLATGHAGVCFKPPAGQQFAEVQAQIDQLLALPAGDADAGSGVGAAGGAGGVTATFKDEADSFGYRWVVFGGGGVDDLVNRVHLVHSTLQDAGWSTQILCSVFGFTAPVTTDAGGGGAGGGAPTIDARSAVYIVYLAKRGTFYPFAPKGDESRDTELEMRIRSALGSDLPVEDDLSKWFPLWELPVP